MSGSDKEDRVTPAEMAALFSFRNLTVKILRNYELRVLRAKLEPLAFRETKICLLLKPILLGFMFVSIICTASPAKEDMKVTLMTMAFAQWARRIKANFRKNKVINDRMLVSH
mmetsp:Transcript_22244/g.34428  ORF Transcript_22244/g.34428 Transcript_22244/m.34428 type:complete len:113 (+) Transcript_22244:795-1133(+)